MPLGEDLAFTVAVALPRATVDEILKVVVGDHEIPCSVDTKAVLHIS